MHKFIKELLKGEKVEWKTIGELCEVIRGVTYKKTDEEEKIGLKVLRANNITSVNNVFNFNDIKLINLSVKVKNSQKLYKDDILISTASGSREHVGKIAYAFDDMDYFFGGFMSVIRNPSPEVLPRFIFHILTSDMFQKYLDIQLKTSTLNNINTSVLKEFLIPIPSIKVQLKIVDILDKFCKLKSALKTEKILREKQYAFYRDKLLGFGEEVPWKMLKEICIRQKGTKITALQMREIHKENAPIKIFAGGQTVAFVNYGDIPEKDIHNIPSIICKSRGIVGFEYYDKPFSHKNELWSYRAKDGSINLKFVYYFLKNNEDYFQLISQKMQMPQIATPVTDDFKIPLPTIEKQNEIVEILEKFDKLTNSITEGLPREIELREKQYCYYRDQLLNFIEE